jgi:hypothetical protein
MIEEDIIKNSLRKLGFEVVKSSLSGKQFYLLGRVKKSDVSSFLKGMEAIMQIAEGSAWDIDVSKPFFLKEGEMVHAWRIIYALNGVELTEVAGAHTNSTNMDDIEIPLAGVRSGDRNMPKSNGAGVRPVSSKA